MDGTVWAALQNIYQVFARSQAGTSLVTVLVILLILVVHCTVLPAIGRWNLYRKHKTVQYHTNHSLSRSKTKQGESLAPYESMPRMAGKPAQQLRELFNNPVYLHQYAALGHKLKGPIFRDSLGGPVDLVFIADARCVGAVNRASGRCPGHVVPEAWTVYLSVRDKKRGLFFMDGDEWLQHRRLLNTRLARPRCLRPHVSELSRATASLVDGLWEAQLQKRLNQTVMSSLYRWALECMCIVALGKSIGTFECENEPGFSFDGFVDSIHSIFLETAAMGQMAAAEARDKQTKAWTNFCAACDQALDIAGRYVSEASADCRGKSCLLGELLYQDHLDMDMATRLIADLLLAAADTTAMSGTWLLYALSQQEAAVVRARQQITATELKNNLKHTTSGAMNQLKQDQLRQLQMQPDHLQPDHLQPDHLQQDQLQQLSRCRNIVRETLRLYPVAPFVTRLLSTDCDIGGYHVPANTMTIMSVYSISRDPEYFHNPLQFDPQRWEKESTESHQQTTPTVRGTTSVAESLSSTDKHSDERLSHSNDYYKNDAKTMHRQSQNDKNLSYCPATGKRVSRSCLPLKQSEPPVAQSILSSLPWGLGSRNCVGRPLAETVLTLLVAHLVINYSVKINNTENIHLKMRMISVPSQDLDIELEKL